MFSSFSLRPFKDKNSSSFFKFVLVYTSCLLASFYLHDVGKATYPLPSRIVQPASSISVERPSLCTTHKVILNCRSPARQALTTCFDLCRSFCVDIVLIIQATLLKNAKLLFSMNRRLHCPTRITRPCKNGKITLHWLNRPCSQSIDGFPNMPATILNANNNWWHLIISHQKFRPHFFNNML